MPIAPTGVMLIEVVFQRVPTAANPDHDMISQNLDSWIILKRQKFDLTLMYINAFESPTWYLPSPTFRNENIVGQEHWPR